MKFTSQNMKDIPCDKTFHCMTVIGGEVDISET